MNQNTRKCKLKMAETSHVPRQIYLSVEFEFSQPFYLYLKHVIYLQGKEEMNYKNN